MNTEPMPWRRLVLPSELMRIPAMLSAEEKRYLVWLTAERFEGWGAIVDLGPWLGGSSAALAEGLKRKGKEAQVHSFDLFRWEPGYMDVDEAPHLQDGDDFLPTFLHETIEYSRWIRPYTQDLTRFIWTGGPIEILFVDAAKSWELTNAILQGFGASLVPGRTRVVLQDFRHHTTHWLPLIFDSRPDLWREAESVDEGWTVTFIPLRPLGDLGALPPAYTEESFTLAAAERVLRRRLASESPANRCLLTLGLYRKALIEGSLEKAEQLRQELTAGGATPEEITAAGEVADILVPMGWKAYNQGDYATAQTLAERCLTADSQRPVYAVALLGMSLLRLANLQRARSCIEEVARRLPGFLPATLYRAELELAEGRYRDAETDGLHVLRAARPDDNATVSYALSVLKQAWDQEGSREAHLTTLLEVASDHQHSATFLAYLGQEQIELGFRAEAGQNVKRALDIEPGHELACRLRDHWNLFDPSTSEAGS